MSVNASIKDVGLAATIKRTSGDISTYIYIKPKMKAGGYEFESWMQTDSGVVNGDLIEVVNTLGTDNYLVVKLAPDERAGDFFKYNAVLFKCNNTITTKKYDSSLMDFDTVATNIPCLIIDGAASQESDMGVVLTGFKGTDGSYYLYCQPNGINRQHVIVDDVNINLKIAGSLNPYFAKGLLEIVLKPEGS